MNRILQAGALALKFTLIATTSAHAQNAAPESSGPMAEQQINTHVIWRDTPPQRMHPQRDYNQREYQLQNMQQHRFEDPESRFRRSDPPIIFNSLPIEEYDVRQNRHERRYQREFKSPCADGRYKIDGFVLGTAGRGGGAFFLGDDGIGFTMPLGGNRGDCRPQGW